MKTLKHIGLMALAIVLVATVIGFAETARLGKENSVAFNLTKIVQKTAAYTVTTSDSQVDVTATSANIVITLPSVATATVAGTMRYKIVKKDATTYKIIVTPATGDTIGGESTRYLISDEAYMIISSGPGKDWTVEYETPYIVEDHEAGTYTTGIGSGGLYSATSGSGTVTLTASDCGNVYSMGTGTTTYSLPATVANCKLTFINGLGGVSSELLVDPVTADNIYGGFTLAASVVTIDDTAGDAIANTGATAVKGDFVTLVGDGNVGWFIIGGQGIWAEK
jgi:hypothetical protein